MNPRDLARDSVTAKKIRLQQVKRARVEKESSIVGRGAKQRLLDEHFDAVIAEKRSIPCLTPLELESDAGKEVTTKEKESISMSDAFNIIKRLSGKDSSFPQACRILGKLVETVIGREESWHALSDILLELGTSGVIGRNGEALTEYDSVLTRWGQIREGNYRTKEFRVVRERVTLQLASRQNDPLAVGKAIRALLVAVQDYEAPCSEGIADMSIGTKAGVGPHLLRENSELLRQAVLVEACWAYFDLRRLPWARADLKQLFNTGYKSREKFIHVYRESLERLKEDFDDS